MQKKWWHDKVAYQIYPKSFHDSNGDGIGDIRGIIDKLDYLKKLGIDIIWISPMYPSPFADQGYDISDYYSIDPIFGNMDDMDELLAEAKKRDMYILMDLVVNHCSDEHEWFQRAIEDPNSKYADYFYFEEVEDGEPFPSNIRSYFGGDTWERIPGTNRYYFHAFHKKQPDLNWENPEVREEIYKMMNWWLERGLAGFRIDAIINIKKDLPWKHYPADGIDGLVSFDTVLAEAKGVGEFLGEMHDRTFKLHDSFAVGEVFNITDEELTEFVGENGYFSSIFNFDVVVHAARHKITPEDYKQITFDSIAKADRVEGFYSNIIENHDEPRGVSRYIPEVDLNDRSKKMLAGAYFFLKGIPWIYQGQEIGMENYKFNSIDEIDDVSSKGAYQAAINRGLSDEEALKIVNYMSRDHARTPVQWSSEDGAGFTDSKETWRPINPNYKEINVENQINDQDSVLYFYKKLIEVRKDKRYIETFTYGDFIPIYEKIENLMAYIRRNKSSGEELLVIANYQNKGVNIQLDKSIEDVLINNINTLLIHENILKLDPYQLVVLKLV